MIRPSLRLSKLGSRVIREMRMLTPLLLLLLACLIPKISRGNDRQRYEFFPFSHFPMYSDFDERDYYVFVTDRADAPIATETVTFVRSTKLKKIFNDELSQIQKRYRKRKDQLTAEQCWSAGNLTLRWLFENAPPAAEDVLRDQLPLRLYRVYITEEQGKLVETEPERVGEWRPGASAP